MKMRIFGHYRDIEAHKLEGAHENYRGKINRKQAEQVISYWVIPKE